MCAGIHRRAVRGWRAMMAWVASVVCGDAAVDLRRGDASGQERERHAADRRPAAPAGRPSRSVLPSSRGGVPVLSRPMRRSERAEPRREAERGRLADAAGRDLLLADDGSARAGRCRWSAPRRRREMRRAIGGDDAGDTRRCSTIRSSTAASITSRFGVARIAACMAGAVELAVGLGARALHRRPLAAVQHAGTGCRRRRRPGPSGRRAHRSRAPDGPCRARRWPGCRTSRRWWRSGA